MFVYQAAHPFFFGDELIPFAASEHGSQFRATFDSLNSGKPRLLTHAFWALVVDWQLSRSAVGAITAGLWCAVVVGCYRIANRVLGVPWPTALLVAALAGVSRFGVTFAHDYIAGVIELWAMAVFLPVLAIAISALDRRTVGWPALALATAAATAVGMIHERYIAAVAALALVVGAYAFTSTDRGRVGRLVALSACLLAVPPLAFALGTFALSELPITTGTAGQPVVLGSDTLAVFGRHMANALLGTNFGHEWLVGAGLRWPWGAGVLVLSLGVLVASVYAALRWPMPRHRLALFCGAIVALAAVASLPGGARAEARWMFPVGILAAMLASQIRPPRLAHAVLAIMLAWHLAYHFAGGLGGIANVSASGLARAVGSVAARADTPKGVGALLGFPEPDISWVVGAQWLRLPDADRAQSRFSTANGLATTLIPERWIGEADAHRVAYGIARVAESEGLVMLGGVQALAVRDPSKAPPYLMKTLGGMGTWEGWNWSDQSMIRPDGVALSRQWDGWKAVEVDTLRGKAVVYEAMNPGEGRLAMRLQVNWVRADQSLISASIRVVEVDAALRSHAMLLAPPPGAKLGLVYATLHDAARCCVLLRSVRLMDLE